MKLLLYWTSTCRLLLIATLSFSAGCKPSASSPSTTEQLPFFSTSDWTAQWIDPTDKAYSSIHQIPAFQLTDQLGRTVTEKDLDGKITVANFFFIRCRSICPKMASNMRMIQDAFLGDSSVLLLSHSVDPESDSVPVLLDYANAQGVNASQWKLLTGERDDIYTLARSQYFAGDSLGLSASGRDFLHTEDIILLDAKRRIRGCYNGTLRSEVGRILEDIAILQKE